MEDSDDGLGSHGAVHVGGLAGVEPSLLPPHLPPHTEAGLGGEDGGVVQPPGGQSITVGLSVNILHWWSRVVDKSFM